MKCTVIDFGNWRKELYYWTQEMAWLSWIVYDVAEDKIDMIRTCETTRIQEVINLICLTSRRAHEVPMKTNPSS